jgi:hypothetical protein
MEEASMTTNNATPQSDEVASAVSANRPEANTTSMASTPDAPPTGPEVTTLADGLAELDELLSKLDNPELVSIRRLFNMC